MNKPANSDRVVFVWELVAKSHNGMYMSETWPREQGWLEINRLKYVQSN
jgi:hypothetical protein